MDIKPIYNKQDYNKALKKVETLWGAKKNTPEGDELDIICTLIEKYESEHYPVLPPDPVEAIIFRMEQMNLKKADLAVYLGGASRVSEILQRKRSLTVKMISALYKNLGIPPESLLSAQ